LPILHADLQPDAAARSLAGRRVFAFAGIGRPDKFFTTLQEAGAIIAETRSFPDHHRYTSPQLSDLLNAAARLAATPVTTPKDAARLPSAARERIHVAGVRLVWTEPDRLDELLTKVSRSLP
jgi:tetraacyldisaccharide 4'-kinase